VFEPVAPFSGGEKARLVLALTAWRRPNLLLLDEPTNHLDLEMRQALAMALQEYAGAVVIVSHDRHLLRTVSDAFLLVHDGRAREFDGDLDDYARWLASPSTSARPAPPAARAAARQAPRPAVRLKPLQTRIARAEQRMAELARETAAIDARLSSPEAYERADHDALRDLAARRAAASEELAQVEAQWLAASEELEQLQQDVVR
jgi:ATP-binding cassette subfamily F protein 3